MPAQLNHTIVASKDKHEAAGFLARILGLGAPREVSHFVAVALDNGATLDYDDEEGEIHPQHYAFLVTDAEFDPIYQRILDESVDYWADPGCTVAGKVNNRNGGRGFYFRDPDGHLMEVFTKVPLP